MGLAGCWSEAVFRGADPSPAGGFPVCRHDWGRSTADHVRRGV